jgi:hypothetical protein
MEDNVQGRFPNGPVYSPRQISLAAFLGSPIAAGWFFSRNYAALGDESSSSRSLWLGMAATVGVIALANALPAKFPSALLPILYTAAIEQYASRCFKTKYEKQLAKGGSKGSWWTVVRISIVICVILIAVLVAAAWLQARFAHGT